LRAVNVISRTSIMQFRDRANHSEIAASTTLTPLGGSSCCCPAIGPRIRRERRVRVNTELIHAGADSQLWNRTFETVFAGIISLQTEI
jgi:hypothetical protein